MAEPSDTSQHEATGRRALRGRLIRSVLLSLAITPFVLGGFYLVSVAFLSRPSAGLPPQDPLSEAEHERKVGAETTSVVGQAPADEVALPSQTPADPRWAFLLLGYGGGSHDGAYLTDSMMLAIADPTEKTLTLLSIPRDCWVPLLFDGKSAIYNKLNTAYAYAKDGSLYPNRLARYAGSHGAGRFTVDTISRLLGVPVANYLGLDFAGFREMINTIGGIDVGVPDSFSANYPANDDASIDPGWATVRFRKGVEHMNGERAIQFARAREAIDTPSESNDFARSRRQRLIMEAFKTRLFQPGGLIHLPQILAITARHVDTDYAMPEVSQLSQFIMDWKSVRIYQTALNAGNYLEEGTGPGGSYVLVPSGPDHTWAQIRAFARRLWQDPATGVAMADTGIVIVNDTGKPGVGGRLSAALSKLGYRVTGLQTGPERAESRLVDRTGGSAKLVAAQLARDLGVSFLAVEDAAAGDRNALVLELGANDAYLADLQVATDDTAPSSTLGIRAFGEWLPPAAPAMPEGSATATPTASGQGLATPQRTVTPTGTPAAVRTATATVRATATPRPTSTPGRKRK